MSFICASCLEPQSKGTKVQEVTIYRRDGSILRTLKSCARCAPLLTRVLERKVTCQGSATTSSTSSS